MRNITLLFLALLLAVSSALAQETPKRKSGLWEITRTTTRTDDKPNKDTLCADEKADNALWQLAEGARKEVCKADKVSRNGDKLVVDATCRVHDSTSKTHAVISGKFDSAYKIESKSSWEPPLGSMAQGHATIEGKWVGPCPAGQRPGDLIMANGVKTNLYDAVHAARNAADAKAKGVMPAPAHGYPPFPNR
jgi:hypothetical protein